MSLQIGRGTFNVHESKRLATGSKSYELDENVQAIPLSHLICGSRPANRSRQDEDPRI